MLALTDPFTRITVDVPNMEKDFSECLEMPKCPDFFEQK